MAVKLPDTLVPMADFPSAFAKDVQFTDGENLQDKLDKGKLGSSSSGTGLTEEQANNIEKIPSIEGIVTSNSQAIANKADKDHEHTEYLTEIPDEYVTDTELSSKGYTTETFVTSKIAEAFLSGGNTNVPTMPPGIIFPFAGSVTPIGYLLCDGRAVNRTDYPYLFNAIGTTYGSGDGNTTFNLPNLQDKFIQGSGTNTVGTEMSAGLPDINGTFSTYDYKPAGATGAFTKKLLGNEYTPNIITGDHSPFTQITLNASKSNSIYGNSDTVQPPAICMNYIIKY